MIRGWPLEGSTANAPRDKAGSQANGRWPASFFVLLLAAAAASAGQTAILAFLPALVDPARGALSSSAHDFHVASLTAVHPLAALLAAGDAVTDEASAMELAGHAPLLVPGGAQNFKVTYPDDFALAEAVLMQRRVAR